MNGKKTGLTAFGLLLLLTALFFLKDTKIVVENQESTKNASSYPDVPPKRKVLPELPVMEVKPDTLEVPDEKKRIRVCYIYPNSRILFQSKGVDLAGPKLEFRFWTRKNNELKPWTGNRFFIKPKKPRVGGISAIEGGFGGYLHYFVPGNLDEEAAMDAVRFAIFPFDYIPSKNENVRDFLNAGREYVIEFKGEGGRVFGRDQIKVPASLEKNQVAVFNLIVDDYDPPLPKVYHLKGKVEGHKDLSPVLVATLSDDNVYMKTILNENGEFMFSSGHPLKGNIYIKGNGAEEPVYGISKPIDGKYVQFPRDAVYWTKLSELKSVSVIIPPSSLPDMRTVLFYYLSYPNKKVMYTKDRLFFFDLFKVYEHELDEFKKDRTLQFQCKPGEYGIYAAWESREEPENIGKIKVLADYQGKTLLLDTNK
ncbi:hypothetical protein BVX99_03070 [bacterium F16]|nr:hypothetical protein BVX99_03070 [bacterium F16]